MEVQAILHQVVKIIRKSLGKKTRIYLFGSWAKGNAQPASDIDIAFRLAKNKQKYFSIIREEIDKIPTLRKIDTIDLSRATEKFSSHILKHAIQL